MEAIGGASAILGLVQQAFHLLERVQSALDHNKEHAMHLTVVSRDIGETKSIIQQIESNAVLQAITIKSTMEAILELANKLDGLVTKQEAKTRNGAGFKIFAQSFAKGPKEQKQLEQLRDELMTHKNSLILGILVNLAPAGTTLSVKDVNMGEAALVQNGRVIRSADDRDFDNMTIAGVQMSGTAFMNNSSVTAEQQERILRVPLMKYKMQFILNLATNQTFVGLSVELRQQLLDKVDKLWDEQSPLSPWKRPQDWPDTHRNPSRNESRLKEGSSRITISKLFHCTTEFWLLVLGEPSWPFSFDPSPLEIAEGNDNANGASPSSRPEKSDAKYEEDLWNYMRIRLGVERDRLCLWKVGVSDQALDGLLTSESEIYCQLGNTILGTLLKIAVSMNSTLDLAKVTGEAHMNESAQQLRVCASNLRKLITDTKEMIVEHTGNHANIAPETSPSLVTLPQFLSGLESNVAKLSKFSVHIKLAISNQT